MSPWATAVQVRQCNAQRKPERSAATSTASQPGTSDVGRMHSNGAAWIRDADPKQPKVLHVIMIHEKTRKTRIIVFQVSAYVRAWTKELSATDGANTIVSGCHGTSEYYTEKLIGLCDS